jgi:cell division protein FtsZ
VDKNKGIFKKVKIKVIGIGGGGVTVLKSVAPKLDKIEFLAVNTDSRSLEKLGGKIKPFVFGENITFGLGTGMNPEIGEKAAIESKEKFSKILKNTDFCIFISCLGGGTGSGALPVFLETAKEMKILTLTIATTPFKFEGSQKRKITNEAIKKIQKETDALAVISNEKILKIIDPKTSFYKALNVVNDLLIDNISSLINLIYNTGLINLDFADLKTILKKQDNLAYFQTKEFLISKPIEEITAGMTSNPLYDYNADEAKRILLNIEMSAKTPMQKAYLLSKEITKQNLKAKIIFGLNLRNKKDNKIRITLLATGCGGKFEEKETKKTNKKTKKTAKKGKKPAQKKDGKIEEKKRKESIFAQEPKKSYLTVGRKKTKTIRKSPIEVKKEEEKQKKKFLLFDDELEIPTFLRKKLK